MRLNLNYTERHKSLRIHTQRSACLTLFGNFNINDSKGKYAIYCDAVYSSLIVVGSGYFFHGKMPGCCLPSLTAATALHFTAGDLKLSLEQE
jgi:hypothetical protein